MTFQVRPKDAMSVAAAQEMIPLAARRLLQTAETAAAQLDALQAGKTPATPQAALAALTAWTSARHRIAEAEDELAALAVLGGARIGGVRVALAVGETAARTRMAANPWTSARGCDLVKDAPGVWRIAPAEAAKGG